MGNQTSYSEVTTSATTPINPAPSTNRTIYVWYTLDEHTRQKNYALAGCVKRFLAGRGVQVEEKPEDHLHVTLMTLMVRPTLVPQIEQIVAQAKRNFYTSVILKKKRIVALSVQAPRFVALEYEEIGTCIRDYVNNVWRQIRELLGSTHSWGSWVEGTNEHGILCKVFSDGEGEILRVYTDEVDPNNSTYHTSLTKAQDLPSNIQQVLNPFTIDTNRQMHQTGVTPNAFIVKKKNGNVFLHNLKLHGVPIASLQDPAFQHLANSLNLRRGEWEIVLAKGLYRMYIHKANHDIASAKDQAQRVAYGHNFISYRTSW